jgi:hypothetical protein
MLSTMNASLLLLSHCVVFDSDIMEGKMKLYASVSLCYVGRICIFPLHNMQSSVSSQGGDLGGQLMA